MMPITELIPLVPVWLCHNGAMSSSGARPRVLSGIQPTADSFHIGNYLGALQNWTQLQDEYDAFYCVVDLHAITRDHDPQLLRQRTLVSYAQLLACGIDPDRSTLFVQSHVPEHAQLSWVMECITGLGEAQRMTQFKDKMSRDGAGSVSVGLLTYPILQAADILLYQAAGVPVGEDQRQHLELTRDLAQRFNKRFGETFTVPKALIIKETAKVFDLQDPSAKMSKSLPGGCVGLLDDPKAITKRFKSAVTDSEAEVRFDPENKPGVSNLLTILSAFTNEPVAQIEARYQGQMYGPLKAEVAEVVAGFAEQFARTTQDYLADPAELESMMAAGAHAAREVAARTLGQAYERIGFVPAS